jgi:hypothetical protein
MPAEARQTLELARHVKDVAGPDMAGVWPRAVALLGRQALEEALAELWAARQPSLADCPFRTQWTCLPEYINDDGLALEATYAWYAMSRACHHHTYELDPTVSELDDWLRITGRLVAAVERRAG